MKLPVVADVRVTAFDGEERVVVDVKWRVEIVDRSVQLVIDDITAALLNPSGPGYEA